MAPAWDTARAAGGGGGGRTAGGGYGESRSAGGAGRRPGRSGLAPRPLGRRDGGRAPAAGSAGRAATGRRRWSGATSGSSSEGRVLVLRRRAEGTVPVDSTCPLNGRSAGGVRRGHGGVGLGRRRRRSHLRHAPAGARRWAATWGMAEGGTLPSSAESSGGGVLLGVARGPSTRVLSTKGPSTTSSTERNLAGGDLVAVDVEPAHRARVLDRRLAVLEVEDGVVGIDRRVVEPEVGVVGAAQDVAAGHEHLGPDEEPVAQDDDLENCGLTAQTWLLGGSVSTARPELTARSRRPRRRFLPGRSRAS